MQPSRSLRLILACAGLIFTAACQPAEDPNAPPEEMGDFRLGHNIVVARNAQKVGPSREASAEEWEALLKSEIGKRLTRYDGDGMYHVAVNVDAYALAVPGIPVVLAPKSVLVVSANVWDDCAGKKINEKPVQMTVFEGLTGDTVVGSGLTLSREEQMANLAENAAKRVHDWLLENKAWFGGDLALAKTCPAGLAAAAAAPPAPVAAVPAKPTGPVDLSAKAAADPAN